MAGPIEFHNEQDYVFPTKGGFQFEKRAKSELDRALSAARSSRGRISKLTNDYEEIVRQIVTTGTTRRPLFPRFVSGLNGSESALVRYQIVPYFTNKDDRRDSIAASFENTYLENVETATNDWWLGLWRDATTEERVSDLESVAKAIVIRYKSPLVKADVLRNQDENEVDGVINELLGFGVSRSTTLTALEHIENNPNLATRAQSVARGIDGVVRELYSKQERPHQEGRSYSEPGVFNRRFFIAGAVVMAMIGIPMGIPACREDIQRQIAPAVDIAKEVGKAVATEVKPDPVQPTG